MLKCGDKFCSNSQIKTVKDVEKCITKTSVIMLKRMCFYHRPGEGCKECGGKTVKVAAGMHCLTCGSSG